MTSFFVFGAIGGMIALFFVADWVWAGRLKKKLQSEPSKRPSTFDSAADSSANYAAVQQQGTHGHSGSSGGLG